ncbi:ABC transporter substrate-binding protein [Paenibacillus aestuarii]|uniref:ABC transporter substrate-binding protein n=1 Tax=Paenibacillus aestuarii TaxID=516965 RepID=A0ABW0KAW1_9BACL|nr:extracellular solute-binding protein [Paenibacillus aestuarii]
MIMSIAALALFSGVALAGCSQRTGVGVNTPPDKTANSQTIVSGVAKSGDGEKIKLSFYSTIALPSAQEVVRSITSDFMNENPNIQVELQFPGSEYENMLKVKMGANDLPDVFDTHGWAVTRYGKFLADLKDQPWAEHLTDTIKPVVTDKDGKVYALVLSEAKVGISYNAEILEKYQIKPPKTYDELMAAAETIKTQSKGDVTPFFVSGVDGMTGQFQDLFAVPLFLSQEKNDAQSLLDGSFDWNKYTKLAQMMLDLKKKGYINEDVSTAKKSDIAQRMAQGKIAFVTGEPTWADDARKINPNIKIGLIPVPSVQPGDTPTFTGGERYTMGVWKDGKHLAESKKLLAFFAKPDNMAKLANVTKVPPGLKGIEAKHEFSDFYKQYADIRVFPFFDRVYLPNGMWDVMTRDGTSLISEKVTTNQYTEKMKQEYERLRNK